MANVTASPDEVIKFSTQVMQSAAKTVDVFTKALIALMEAFNNSYFAKELKNHVIDGNDLDFNACDASLYKDFENKLNEKGITHVMVQSSDSGIIYFVTKDTDRDAVRDAKNEVLEEEKRISRVSVQELYRMNVGKNVSSFSDLSDVQVKFFQEQAKKNDFVMAAQRQEDGTYKVFFSEKDAEKATTAMNMIATRSVGICGKIQEERQKANLDTVYNINEHLKNSSNEFFIVSGSNINEFIQVDKQGFQHIKDGNISHLEQKDDSNFVSHLHYQSMGIANPIIFTKEELEQFKALTEKISNETGVPPLQVSAKLATSIHSTYNNDVSAFFEAEQNGAMSFKAGKIAEYTFLEMTDINYKPDISIEELHKIEIERDLRTLIETKLSLDNGNQPENLSSFYNGEVSFSEFFAHEVVNDTHDAEEIKRNDTLINTANRLDNLSNEDKQYLYAIAQETYQELSSHHYSTELVDRARLSRDNLDDFINAHDNDTFNTTIEPNFDNLEI